jgi:hypothetical protein
MTKDIEIGQDLGKVTLKVKSTVSKQLKEYMDSIGYDAERHDICNIIEEGDVVLFKCVHYNALTAADKEYFRIEFVYETDLKADTQKR